MCMNNLLPAISIQSICSKKFCGFINVSYSTENFCNYSGPLLTFWLKENIMLEIKGYIAILIRKGMKVSHNNYYFVHI